MTATSLIAHAIGFIQGRRRLASLGMAFVLATSATFVGTASRAFAAANAICNNENEQPVGDNSWLTRQQNYGSALSEASADISYFDYSVCEWETEEPAQSSSGAWPAVEASVSGNAIIQSGYIKCNPYQKYGCLNQDLQPYLGQTIAFWAWGNNNDLGHMPWPHFLATVPNAVGQYHHFSVFKVNRSTCYWAMTIDHGTSAYHYTTVACSSLTWTPVKAEVGNEVWNSGDQVGGFSGSPQRFDNERYLDAFNGIHYFTQAPQKRGHCLPPNVHFYYPGLSGDDWSS